MRKLSCLCAAPKWVRLLVFGLALCAAPHLLCVYLCRAVLQVSMECDNDTDLQSPIRSLAGILLVLTVLTPAYAAGCPNASPAVVQTDAESSPVEICVRAILVWLPT